MFLSNCSCVSPRVQQKRTAIWCDNRNLHRFISAKIRQFCGHNIIWKRNECTLIFHHLLITLRVDWGIFPISLPKVQGFSTPSSSQEDIDVDYSCGNLPVWTCVQTSHACTAKTNLLCQQIIWLLRNSCTAACGGCKTFCGRLVKFTQVSAPTA